MTTITIEFDPSQVDMSSSLSDVLMGQGNGSGHTVRSGPADTRFHDLSDDEWNQLPLAERGQILFGAWPITQPVKLDKKNDPRFQRKYKTLKEGGCEWDKAKFHWHRPSN